MKIWSHYDTAVLGLAILGLVFVGDLISSSTSVAVPNKSRKNDEIIKNSHKDKFVCIESGLPATL